MNHYFVHDTPIGELILEANLSYLIKISFNRKHLNRIKACSLKKNLIIEKTVEQLDEYFFYNRKLFTINYLLDTTWFFKKVLFQISLIKYGRVKPYKQIAKILKNKNAYRAVANASASNPLPIIIPCHRVIRSSGEVGGYRGGVINKKYLLSLENKTGNFF
tara:strand:- start:111 stop:593 length:483 start_codon:yes stop_codon:yes gene_type:complete